MRETITREDALLQFKVLRSRDSDSAEELLPRVQAPTLVIASRAGTRAFANEESARWLSGAIANSQLLLLDDPAAGLNAVDGEEPRTVTAIAEFVDKLPSPPTGAIRPVASSLSSREQEVLRLLAAGKSNQEIADELVISRNTVLRHVNHIFDNTGASNRVEATSYAHRNRIV